MREYAMTPFISPDGDVGERVDDDDTGESEENIHQERSDDEFEEKCDEISVVEHNHFPVFHSERKYVFIENS